MRTPLVQQNYTKAEQSAVSAASNAFNAQLDAHAQAFGNKHYDAKWHVFDPTPTWNRVIDAPTQFGVQNATCWNADGNSCLFYNNFHPVSLLVRTNGVLLTDENL